jgi:hypothetical protein
MMPSIFIRRSVESFEWKLDKAQRDLNINPRDFIPVFYITETDYVWEGLKA